MIAGIIGSGAMGAGIAQVIATAGNKVLLLDVNADMHLNVQVKI
jgi:3-hydroxybutyryl-CoA dehydrogenase